LLGYIGTVTNWFEEAVGRSSDIREAIRTGAEDNQGSAALIVWVAWCTTGLGVLLLSFFALLSRVVAFYLLRQMEFDADRYEAQVAGSAQFAKTFERLGQLEVGFENTIKAVFTGDLSPDSDVELAEQVVIDADNLSEKHLRRAARHLRPTRAQWFDSHPSPTDRIAAVAKLEEPGIFQLDGPARCLLRMQTLPIENAREIN
jgi:Zn-dependent protease with chaperone function